MKTALIIFLCLISLTGFTQLVKGAKAVGDGITYSKTTQPGYLMPASLGFRFHF